MNGATIFALAVFLVCAFAIFHLGMLAMFEIETMVRAFFNANKKPPKTDTPP